MKFWCPGGVFSPPLLQPAGALTLLPQDVVGIAARTGAAPQSRSLRFELGHRLPGLLLPPLGEGAPMAVLAGEHVLVAEEHYAGCLVGSDERGQDGGDRGGPKMIEPILVGELERLAVEVAEPVRREHPDVRGDFVAQAARGADRDPDRQQATRQNQVGRVVAARGDSKLCLKGWATMRLDGVGTERLVDASPALALVLDALQVGGVQALAQRLRTGRLVLHSTPLERPPQTRLPTPGG